MNTQTRLVLVILGLCTAPAVGADDGSQAMASVDAVRTAGVAMWRMVMDQLGKTETTDEEVARAAEAVTPHPYRWEQCTPIAAARLAEQVVPKYVAELPTKDAWGHALEFCLTWDPSDSSRYLLAVRSPGRDGIFAAEPYETGSFSSQDSDQDIVWIQGIFVRWPTRSK